MEKILADPVLKPEKSEKKLDKLSCLTTFLIIDSIL